MLRELYQVQLGAMSLFACCYRGALVAPPDDTLIEMMKSNKPDDVLVDYIINNPDCINDYDEVSCD